MVSNSSLPDIAWRYVLYFACLHAVGVWGLWYASTVASTEVIVAAAMYFALCHLSITIALHRHFTHAAFEMAGWLQYGMLLLFSGTAQGSAMWWVAKHTQHHSNEDIPGEDPHTPLDGFWYAHFGWLFVEANWQMPEEKYSRKARATAPLRWHDRTKGVTIPLMAFGVPALIGWAAGDVLGGLLVIGFARLLLQYHATWIVNSVGHTFGDRIDNRATNFGYQFVVLPLAAVVTVGEAWHANHHQSSADWRLGRQWWQIDPGAYVIYGLSKIGLVWKLKEPANRKRVPKAA